jgi:hypothetical protein
MVFVLYHELVIFDPKTAFEYKKSCYRVIVLS